MLRRRRRRRRRRRHGCTPDSPRTPMFPRDRYGRPERPLSAVAEPIFFRPSAAHARHPGFPFSIHDHEARRAVEWRQGEDYAAAGASLVISIRCELCYPVAQALEPENYAGVAATNFETLKRFGDEVPANTDADLAFGRQPGTLNRSRGTTKTEGGIGGTMWRRVTFAERDLFFFCLG